MISIAEINRVSNKYQFRRKQLKRIILLVGYYGHYLKVILKIILFFMVALH